MAVTITFDDWVDGLAEEDGSKLPQTTQAVLRRWYDAAVRMVDDYAPSAPAVIADRAMLMIGSYWSWEPGHPATQRQHFVGFMERWTDAKMSGNPLRYSGAMATLTRYKRRRAL